VVALNGVQVADSKSLTRQVASIRAGDRAAFTVMRNGERRTLDATIEKRDADRLASADNPSSRSTEPDALGMGLMPLNPALRQQYELGGNANGVVVGSVDPDSEAARKGINEGDL